MRDTGGREGFGQAKSRLSEDTRDKLIFRLFQNSVLPVCTYLGFPFKLLTALGASLPLTDSEGRRLSFLGAASNQNKYKLLSSLQTSPVGGEGGLRRESSVPSQD